MSDFLQLPPSEWWQLRKVFVSEFGTDEMPDPDRFEVYAKLEEGQIIAFFMLERRVVHGGPFWVAPEHRGNGLAREMAEEAFRLTAGEKGYISATTPEIDHLADSLGLTPIRGRLWHKE